MKPIVTLVAYLAIAWMVYFGTVINDEHMEVEGYASLICHACIGIN